MFFDVLEDVVVGVSDDETFTENVDDRSNVEVLRSVVRRRLRQTTRPSYATTVQVFTTHEAGIAYWRFVDGQRVI